FFGATFYSDSIPIEEEIPLALEKTETAEKLIKGVINNLLERERLEIQPIQELAEILSDTIIRNPDALLLIRQLKKERIEQYERSLDVSAYLIAFGRHLCLSREELSDLAIGGFLMDIGLIKNRNLECQDPEHVIDGEQILEKNHIQSVIVQNVLSQHHEHEDGTGFPRHLKGNELSPMGGWQLLSISMSYYGQVIRKPELYLMTLWRR
ncbi:HD-GYP domain-containing protein, partial [Legionella norrlandica]|uniref:HD-GYP domain-containing protein n=1 Tax=Legionella norrlandica TaxID=1498499 RepID=UPI0019D3F7B8